jgi:hypothetical protein
MRRGLLKKFTRRRLLFCAFLIAGWVFIPAGYALGSSEKAEGAAGDIREYTLTISGVVRITGTGAFPRLVISSGDGRDYLVDTQSPAREGIWALQGQRISVEALVREYPVYAGKKYLGIEYVIVPKRFDPVRDAR